MTDVIIPLAILRGATVVAGTIFLVFTAQAYHKHRSRSLLMLASAIALMVVAVLAEGVAFFLFGASLGVAETVEAGITLVAFLVLLWSVRQHTPPA